MARPVNSLRFIFCVIEAIFVCNLFLSLFFSSLASVYFSTFNLLIDRGHRFNLNCSLCHIAFCKISIVQIFQWTQRVSPTNFLYHAFLCSWRFIGKIISTVWCVHRKAHHFSNEITYFSKQFHVIAHQIYNHNNPVVIRAYEIQAAYGKVTPTNFRYASFSPHSLIHWTPGERASERATADGKVFLFFLKNLFPTKLSFLSSSFDRRILFLSVKFKFS